MQFFILILLQAATSGLYICIKYRKLFVARLLIPGIGNPVISFSRTQQTVFFLCNKNNDTKTIFFVDEGFNTEII
jgi:predicted peptidase